MVNFDLQTFLSEMRKEQREDHESLSLKVDNLLETMQDHETRIVIVENTRKNMRWLAGTVIVGLVTFLLDLIANHKLLR